MSATWNKPCSAIFLLVLLLTGCATRSYREDSPPPAMPPDSSLLTSYQTQIAIGQCAFKPRKESAVLSAIATALITSAISQGVNYLGKATEEAAKETGDRVTATRNIETTARTFGPCIQIVRGWFYRGFERTTKNHDDSDSAFTKAKETWANTGKPVNTNQLRKLWTNRLWLAAQPDFIFEAEIVPTSLGQTPDDKLLTLAPVYARLDNPISKAWLRPSTARKVAVFVAFHDAGKDPIAPENAAGGMILGQLETGADRYFPPPVNKDDMEERGSSPNRDPNESRWFQLAIDENNKKPMTITALVTEHQDKQPFLQFVADVFGQAKEPIATALQNALVPSLREKAGESETAMNEAVSNTYEKALVSVLTVTAACVKSAPDPVATASEVRSEVRALNKAARALGKSTFKEDYVPFSTVPSEVQGGCKELREKLLNQLNAESKVRRRAMASL